MTNRHMSRPGVVRSRVMEELPPTAWAVLGLWSFDRERSGYDLRKWANASLRFCYGSPAMSQIYRELRRLESCGYAASRPAPSEGARRKRLYRITSAGRDGLAAWLRHAPVEAPVLKHSVALRV